MCDLSAALVSAVKNKKGDAAISAAAEKNKKEDAGLANIGNGLIAPRSQLGFGTVPCAKPTLVKKCRRFVAVIATWTLQGYSCYRQAISVNPSAFGSSPISSGTMQ